MVVIVPFRGIRYDPGKIPDLSRVVAPPYDVISPQAQEELYRRNPYNVIRLILNKETPEDSPDDNRYTRASRFYRTWLEEGILVRARVPHFYFLREEFDLPSVQGADRSAGSLKSGDSPQRRKVRRGFIGLIRLEAFQAGVVLPHEKTQTKPKADRLALMEACRANFSQIFSLYTDAEGLMTPIYDRVFSSPTGPAFDITDSDGVRHTLWMVSDEETLHRVREIMGPKKIFISDGHHRYETALAYREKQRARFPGEKGREPYHFTMMYLTAMEDEGVSILATHRVITGMEGFQASSFMEKIGANFSIESFPFTAGNERTVRERFLLELSLRSETLPAFGMLLRESPQYFLLFLKNDRAMDQAAPALSPALKNLDVNILHILIFQELLNIGPQELAAQKNILYFKDPQEAIGEVQCGRALMGFLLNPTRVYQVRDVALAGETMPSKSTFFYPKLLSGGVINPLDPDEEISVE